MAYTTTKYQAQFAGRVLSNLTALLERDAETAVAEIDPELPPFKDFRTPTPIALKFPALFVNVERVEPVQSDDDSYIQQTQTYGVDVAIVGKDSYSLQAQIVNYVLAIDRIIRSATAADFVGELDSKANGVVWEVTAHDYLISKAETTLRADARLTVVIQLFER